MLNKGNVVSVPGVLALLICRAAFLFLRSEHTWQSQAACNCCFQSFGGAFGETVKSLKAAQQGIDGTSANLQSLTHHKAVHNLEHTADRKPQLAHA